jgi:hypothetical protein
MDDLQARKNALLARLAAADEPPARRPYNRFLPRLDHDHRDVRAVMQHGVALEWQQGLRTDQRDGPGASAGALTYVMTASSPGARSAASTAMWRIAPLELVKQASPIACGTFSSLCRSQATRSAEHLPFRSTTASTELSQARWTGRDLNESRGKSSQAR